MRKRILCLAMMTMMVLGIPMTANAEDIEGAKDWAVTFTGKEMTSNFSGSDAADEVLQNLQPGDSIHLQVALDNQSGKSSDWYMKNEVIESLEDNSIAAGGAYTYILTYVDPDGNETVIYSNDRVGGENDSAARSVAEEGLHQATNTLDKEHFFLDRLKDGQKGTVHLTVALDGETQGNDYQKTLAKLRMDFAAEVVKTTTRKDVTTVKQDKEIVQERLVSVRTGDTTPIVLISTIALLSGVILMVIAMKQMNDRRQRRGQ